MITIEIAEIPIAIDNYFDIIELWFGEYRTSRQALFTVSASAEDMKRETGEISPYAEWLCINREIALIVPAHNAFLMHAAVVDIDGQGVAFAAKSGTGKTTRVLMWKKAMGSRVKVVNGDKPILRFLRTSWYAFGTPWMGKENLGENTSVGLKYICFLKRGEEVALLRLQPREAVPLIFRQVLMPKERRQIVVFMELLERFAKDVNFFLLTCNMDDEDPAQIWEQMQMMK